MRSLMVEAMNSRPRISIPGSEAVQISLRPASRPGVTPSTVQGRPVVLRQTWSSIVWCHWRVPVETLAGRFPPGVSADVFDGSAWVGLVPFEMRDLRAVVAGRALPPIPTATSFSEVNVRTYVTGPNGPGVWFDSLDASSRLGSFVARWVWSLPYLPSRIKASASDGPTNRTWSVERANGTTSRMGATAGDVITDKTPLDQFLTERYALYARAWWAPKRSLWAPVDHDPWVLRSGHDVTVGADLVRAAGYEVTGGPEHVVCGDAAQVRIGLPRLLQLAHGRAGTADHRG